MIDVPALIACGVHPTQAKVFADPLMVAFARWAINTPLRMAAFIAQAMEESDGFTAMEENLHYSHPDRIVFIFRTEFPGGSAQAAAFVGQPVKLANHVYANRNGNGDEASGDGWKFRGRGIFQLTGKANYVAAGSACGRNFAGDPDLVAQPLGACDAAGWYWNAKGCQYPADARNFDSITRRINPGMAGAARRRDYYSTCLKALNAI